MIVRLNGGMCNQMFQYAFGRSVSQRRGELLFFEPQDLGKGCHRAYSLDAFKVNVNWAGGMLGPDYTEKANFRYDEGVYTAAPDSFFKGCWQTEKYFDLPLVRAEMQLRRPVSFDSQRVASQIIGGPSAFIHVRRTDYLKPHAVVYHGNMGLDYYREAVNMIWDREPNTTFFVFSDDPDWCRQNFPGPGITGTVDAFAENRFVVVGHNKMGSGDKGPGTEHEDLFLMSLCENGIMANSSFSWWGAWLGEDEKRRPDRIIVGPKKWFVTPKLDSSDIMPERWVKI